MAIAECGIVTLGLFRKLGLRIKSYKCAQIPYGSAKGRGGGGVGRSSSNFVLIVVALNWGGLWNMKFHSFRRKLLDYLFGRASVNAYTQDNRGRYFTASR
jgi:hypothetical protein